MYAEMYAAQQLRCEQKKKKKLCTEWCDGQACACTFHPWRFGFVGSTTYVVKIVLLIEHSVREQAATACARSLP